MLNRMPQFPHCRVRVEPCVFIGIQGKGGDAPQKKKKKKKEQKTHGVFSSGKQRGTHLCVLFTVTL